VRYGEVERRDLVSSVIWNQFCLLIEIPTRIETWIPSSLNAVIVRVRRQQRSGRKASGTVYHSLIFSLS
ncbi:hypothetical protein LOAG_16179, partial [Loa loa]